MTEPPKGLISASSNQQINSRVKRKRGNNAIYEAEEGHNDGSVQFDEKVFSNDHPCKIQVRDHQERDSKKTQQRDQQLNKSVRNTQISDDVLSTVDSSNNLLEPSGNSSRESTAWPNFFKQLEKTHQALNLIFTFCCTRKQLSTKFETIKSAVEANIKRPLEIEEVAQIVALRPTGIKFAFVDEALLQVDVVHGANSKKNENNCEDKRFSASNPTSSCPDIYKIDDRNKTEQKGREVLLFEFIDGDLKRQAQSKETGHTVKVTRRLRDEALKMPVYSQKQILGLIKKRNSKFTNAVKNFLKQCLVKGIDPVEKIKTEALLHVPVSSENRRTSFGLSGKSVLSVPPSIKKERNSISEIITELKQSEFYTGQIVPNGHRVFDPQEAIYGNLNFRLSQNMVNALHNAKNISQFYFHQAEAINNLHDGHHVIVATSTSSGKSLIYQIPVLYELEQDPHTRAMYIFPTKALAQDQQRSLREMMQYMHGLEETIVETFDGDTEMEHRNLIRDEGRIILTNPDMLHMTILPNEEKWRGFLKALKYVVVDEIHIYNGLFGSHVALIMRRLRRICAAVGNRSIQFISCSATVANPLEHFKTIFGIDEVKITNFDGSPSGRKEFLFWNTPFKDPEDPTSGRGDITAEAAKLFCHLILRRVRVIAFCRVRRGCEALVGAVKDELTSLGRLEYMELVMGYRGGYTPQDRRKIEKHMFEGKLMGIVATTALELGVDIGSLDAVITVGFPYTISNLRQQSGRAGRRNKDSLSILVGDRFPTDQHYMENPDEVFTKPNSELQVDLQNILILEGHIQCAAHEMPICIDQDIKYFPKILKDIAKQRLIKDNLGFYHCHDRFLPVPSKFVSIRDTEEDHFAVIDVSHGCNNVLEELEASRAFFTLYDGGIYLHQGNTYLIKEFNPDRKIAMVELVRVDWTTQQRDFTDIDPVEIEAVRRIPGTLSRAFFGKIKIQKTVFGFFKIDKRRRILDAVQVDNPPIIIFSKGIWLDVPKRALDILVKRRLNVSGAIHAAEHAILSLMPNFVISMPGDVRTKCKIDSKELAPKKTMRKRPARLTFYDSKGGASGSGISTKAFEFIDLLLKQAVQRVSACHCLDGCVECVKSELCKHVDEIMSKAGAQVILKTLLNLDIDIDSLPMGPEDESAESSRMSDSEIMVQADPVLPKGRIEILERSSLDGNTDVVVGILDELGVEAGVAIKVEPRDELLL
ncbi:ATP-dependent helicase HRQ1 [Golovinomyces cichoracearum]|uniref:ATP-dependent helicase HRQ1 n=1 Tax=Golovinomyces cichoracearum TaxID=62708 RepID=A0A420J5F3_9PEZI|nr:ATP-dependent helicase HRQ1 [Golovinomyces cichoracearum]